MGCRDSLAESCYGPAVKYVPALDGLRALAVMAVVAFHARVSGFSGGLLGVDLFFALSGYLITSILADEYARTGRLDIRGFYLRRAKRLYPALLFFLAVYVCVAPLIWPGWNHALGALAAGAYVMDYTRYFPAAHYLMHTWSLAAEVHFYLLWPFVLLWILRTGRPLAQWLLCISLVALAWTLTAQIMGVDAYHHADTRIYQMAFGGWLAVAKIPVGRMARLGAWAGLAGLAALVYSMAADERTVLVAGPLAVAVAMPLIHGAGKLPVKWLAWTGRMSYGVYLWHLPIIMAINTRFSHGETFAIASIASIALAALSYYTVEAVFRRKRKPRMAMAAA